MQWIKRAWRGEEKLWKVFWYPTGVLFIFSMAAGFSVVAALFLAKKMGWNLLGAPLTATTGGYTPETAWWMIFAPAGLIVLGALITVWQNISLWRCAFNSSLKLWAYLARIWVVLSWLGLIGNFVSLLTTLPALMGNTEALYKQTCIFNMAAYAREKDYVTGSSKEELSEYIKQKPDDLKKCVQNLIDKNH